MPLKAGRIALLIHFWHGAFDDEVARLYTLVEVEIVDVLNATAIQPRESKLREPIITTISRFNINADENRVPELRMRPA